MSRIKPMQLRGGGDDGKEEEEKRKKERTRNTYVCMYMYITL